MRMNMDDLVRLPKNDPTELFRYRDGIYAAELLAAAVTGLDFFSWLAKSPASAKTICSALGLTERPVDVMLTLFSAMRMVEKSGDTFRLTETAREFLVRDSQWFLGPYYSSFVDHPMCRDLLDVLRSGKPAGWASRKDQKPWAQAMEGDTFARQFTKIMDSRGVYLGRTLAQQLDLKNHRRLLDVAGGSGIYACSIVAAHPHMKATVFEKPPVDRIARECIVERGCAERVDVTTGDMFADALPENCDVHLWSNVLHDWGAPTVETLLKKSFAALPPDGMIVIHDSHINREKTGPLAVAAYSVLLMASTEGKCYSVPEMENLLGAAGFAGVDYRETAADRSVITARKPKC
jgi:precorrin-6B methylase 2